MMAKPDDVHVDWHMTYDEWAELVSVLSQHTDMSYIKSLFKAGKIPSAEGVETE